MRPPLRRRQPCRHSCWALHGLQGRELGGHAATTQAHQDAADEETIEGDDPQAAAGRVEGQLGRPAPAAAAAHGGIQCGPQGPSGGAAAAVPVSCSRAHTNWARLHHGCTRCLVASLVHFAGVERALSHHHQRCCHAHGGGGGTMGCEAARRAKLRVSRCSALP